MRQFIFLVVFTILNIHYSECNLPLCSGQKRENLIKLCKVNENYTVNYPPNPLPTKSISQNPFYSGISTHSGNFFGRGYEIEKIYNF